MKIGLKMQNLNTNPTDPLEDNMDNLLYKIGLGLAVALIVCLFPMPYGYYTLVRFVAMIIFGCMAFSFYKNTRMRIFHFVL